jgi:hypothetical protein
VTKEKQLSPEEQKQKNLLVSRYGKKGEVMFDSLQNASEVEQHNFDAQALEDLQSIVNGKPENLDETFEVDIFSLKYIAQSAFQNGYSEGSKAQETQVIKELRAKIEQQMTANKDFSQDLLKTKNKACETLRKVMSEYSDAKDKWIQLDKEYEQELKRLNSIISKQKKEIQELKDSGFK